MAAPHHDDVGWRADRTQVELVLFFGRRSEGDLDHRKMQAEIDLTPAKRELGTEKLHNKCFRDKERT